MQAPLWPGWYGNEPAAYTEPGTWPQATRPSDRSFMKVCNSLRNIKQCLFERGLVPGTSCAAQPVLVVIFQIVSHISGIFI